MHKLNVKHACFCLKGALMTRLDDLEVCAVQYPAYFDAQGPKEVAPGHEGLNPRSVMCLNMGFVRNKY